MPIAIAKEHLERKSLAESNWHFVKVSPAADTVIKRIMRNPIASDETILEVAIALVSVALKAEEQGLHLAVVDKDDVVIADIERVTGTLRQKEPEVKSKVEKKEQLSSEDLIVLKRISERN